MKAEFLTEFQGTNANEYNRQEAARVRRLVKALRVLAKRGTLTKAQSAKWEELQSVYVLYFGTRFDCGHAVR